MLITGPFSSVRGSRVTTSEYGDSPLRPRVGWTCHGGIAGRCAVGIFGQNDYLSYHSWRRPKFTPWVWVICAEVEKWLKFSLSPQTASCRVVCQIKKAENFRLLPKVLCLFLFDWGQIKKAGRLKALQSKTLSLPAFFINKLYSK